MSWWIAFSLGWIIFLVWAAKLIPALRYVRTHHLAQFLTRTPIPTPEDLWPLLSVIVPAKNEAESIEQGLRSLLANDYPRLEIIAVNDRSTDSTGEIMERLAGTDPRLRVLHVTELPPDWLGKNHAMHLAASQAAGEFLLFTDGDILFAPETLRSAVRIMQHDALDQLTLYPQMIIRSRGEEALASFFGFMFLLGTSSWSVATSNPRSYAGIGAFNMVRATSYRRAGGHAPLHLEVLDDVRLGQLMKDSGASCQLLIGGPALRVRWQASLWQMIRGLEKNAFASVGYSLPYLAFAIATLLFLVYGPLIGLLLSPPWDLRVTGYLLTFLFMHAGFADCCRQIQGSARPWYLLLVGAFLFTYAYARSCLVTYQQRGVRWRDTFYPLKTLRSHQYLTTRRRTS